MPRGDGDLPRAKPIGEEIDYRVVVAKSAEELAGKVKKLLARGWELQGGDSVAVSSNPYVCEYCQSLIRHSE
jgi:hypothetical protein